MKLIIAEKPSVRDNIATALNATERLMSDSGKNFCLYNDTYYVANTVGHLYGIGLPTDYGFSKNFRESYSKGELPMFPETFISRAGQNDSKDDLRDFLYKLINKADVEEIICATDVAHFLRNIYK